VLSKDHPGLGQLKAGYYTSTFGFLNVVTRPFGGWLGDKIYMSQRFGGVRAKKYLTIVLGVLQGAMSLAYGLVSPLSTMTCYLELIFVDDETVCSPLLFDWGSTGSQHSNGARRIDGNLLRGWQWRKFRSCTS